MSREQDMEMPMDEHFKRVAAHHNHLADKYDADFFEHFALSHRVSLDNLKRFLPIDKGTPILDAGGGTGIWTVELAKMGFRVVLTDISEELLARAREKLAATNLADKVDIRVSNICHMPEFRDEQFGMVLCQSDPLSYCGDHQAAIKEFVRVVKPGGTVIASVDSRGSALNWPVVKQDRDAVRRLLETGDVALPHDREEHSYVIHAFTPDELRELFEANGLSVERIIGKPVIAQRLSFFKSEDPAIQDWLYSLELQHNSDPAYLPLGGHLEIVGRKR